MLLALGGNIRRLAGLHGDQIDFGENGKHFGTSM
jgi:hypothetical protein